MWIGTMGGMAYMEDGQILSVGPREIVSAMVVDGQGQVWSGGDAGKVFKWEGQTPQMIAVAEDPHSGEISGLCEDGQGRIWATEFMGRLGWIEQNRFTPLAGWMFEECRALLQDQNGVFWVSSYGMVPALYYYEDGQFCPAEVAEIETIAYVNVLW